MSRIESIQRIIDDGIIAVVRAENSDQAVKIANACRLGGITALEITYTIPGATEVIARLAHEFMGSEMLVGAGTVLDSETARSALLAGAQFVVSPYLNTDVIALCNRYDILSMPGVMTVTEVVTALNAGALMLKAFPGEVLGPAFIKAILGPLPHVQLVPTGGVSLDNVDQWITAGAAAVGVGGNLMAGSKTGDYAAITAMAQAFVEKVRRVPPDMTTARFRAHFSSQTPV